MTLTATAQETRPSWREIWKWREAWSGVDVARDNWLIYSGITVPPFSHIHEPGVMLRLADGYGQYKYSGNRSTTLVPNIVSFSAATYYGDALVGYLERFGPLTAKAFGGVTYCARSNLLTRKTWFMETKPASKACSNSGSTSVLWALRLWLCRGAVRTIRAMRGPG